MDELKNHLFLASDRKEIPRRYVTQRTGMLRTRYTSWVPDAAHGQGIYGDLSFVFFHGSWVFLSFWGDFFL